jgi:uncharacterized BrkB/YihY/UPF0761 family membrane protein
MSPMPADEPTSRRSLASVRRSLDERKKTALERVELERERRGSVRIALGSFELDRRTGGSLLAGGLAYRLFLWLLPFGLFTSSLIRLVSDSGGPTASDVARDIGMSGEMIATIENASRAAGQNALWLLIVGLALMLFAARTVLRALSIASALAWGVDVGSQKKWLRSTLVTACALLVLSGYHYLLGPLYAGRLTTDLLATGAAAIAMALAVAWGASLLPHPDGVPWPYFLPGGMLFGFGVEGLRLVTSVYLAARLERVDNLYGALGVGAAFMAVLYLVARLTTAALALNAATWQNLASESSEIPDAPRGT